MTCPSCEQTTPEGRFCIRCGAPLADDWEGKSRTRSHFAAASHQHVAHPALISTLFPHLPRASQSGFRLALAFGLAVVAGLAALRLFPMALIAAALLLPLLVVLYLIDVDVYEGEPPWAVAFVILWGAVAGVGFGLLAIDVAPSAVDVIAHGDSQNVVQQGLLLPFAGLLVLLIGPVLLLPYHRFNDVLDGVTFGTAAAAAFGGAQAITYGVHYFGSGVRPAGAIAPWIWRLLSLGLGMPIVTMGAAAAACAALWLRYRAPARDCEALGPAGHPVVALPLAAALVMGAAVGETFLPPWGWLLWLAAFDVVVIIMLRRAIHVGLLEEALEIPIGPEIACPNCGAQTARHTFCGNCGISLQALPKTRPRRSEPVAMPASEPPA
ncbi:MAG TPA: zinc ribbon domain-containing protein [Solirubrobacteraceae bacterium]|jgi:ribosomal protein L32